MPQSSTCILTSFYDISRCLPLDLILQFGSMESVYFGRVVRITCDITSDAIFQMETNIKVSLESGKRKMYSQHWQR